jgi:hypothetical protein
MMVTANWFVSATEARNNIVKDIAVHGEISAVEQQIMQAVQRGDYQVTVSGESPFTLRPDMTSEVFTVDVITNTLQVTTHGFAQGDVVTVHSTQLLPAPLKPLTYYYVIYVDEDHIKLAVSRTDAQLNRPIPINIAPGVGQISLTNVGAGYVTAPPVMLSGGTPQVPAQAVASLSNRGVLRDVQVLTGGSGYTYTPTVIVTVAGSGAQAGPIRMKVVQITGISFGGSNYNVGDTLTLITGGGSPAATIRVSQVDGGSVTQVQLLSGGLYLSDQLPDLMNSITTSSGIGSGCSLNVIMGVATIAVADGGLSYAQPPLVSITGGGGSQAQAVAQLTGGVVSAFVVTNPGSGYTGTPDINITSGENATVVAQLAPTSVSRVDVVNSGGAFYVDTPQVQLTTPGTGAQAGIIRMKVVDVNIRSQGQSYVVGDQIYVSGGVGIRNAVLQVTQVSTLGGLQQVQIVDGGAYTQLPVLQNNPVYGGTGINAAVDVQMGVDDILIQTPGVNYQVPPLVIISGVAVRPAQADARIVLGGITEVRIMDPGIGYQSVPVVTFTCGEGAQAQAILSATGVQFVDVINPGSGYTQPPTVTITGGGGTGAQAEAIIDDGSITFINVTAPGSGYTGTPQVVIAGGATAQVSLIPTSVHSIEILDGGENYVLAPTVVLDGPAQALSVLMPTSVKHVSVTNAGENYASDPILEWIPSLEETGTPIPPTVRTQRSFSLSEIVVTNTGDNYQDVPTVTIGAPAPGGVQATATATLSVGSGLFHVMGYTPSQDYWKVNCGQSPSSDLLVRPYRDRISSVKKYFEDLGYSMQLETNPATGVTLQWTIRW